MAPRPAAARVGLRLTVGLAKLLASLVLALAVFLVGAYFQVRGALPPYAGHYEVKGLKAPVEILRDRNAVPHIVAGSIEDAAYGLGFVHAQDRFWQMELMRRSASGRIAEIAGRPGVPLDRAMRTYGIARLARDDWAALPNEAKELLEAYARGVNAWIAERGPREFDYHLPLEITRSPLQIPRTWLDRIM